MSVRRADNRTQGELRNISISFDGLAGVDGSARFSFGSSKALASVSGPIEVRLASEQASKATFEVIVRPLAGIPGTEAKAMAASLRTALTPSIILTTNPRTLIQLVVQSLSPSPQMPKNVLSSRSNPSQTAALINASSLALLNTASFPMHGVVCSAAIGRLKSSRSLIVDPSDEELASLDGGGVFAFMFSDRLRDEEEQDSSKPQSKSDGQLIWSQWNAVPFTENELVLASSLAQEATRKVLRVFREAVGSAMIRRRDFEEQRIVEKTKLPSTQSLLSDAMDIA